MHRFSPPPEASIAFPGSRHCDTLGRYLCLWCPACTTHIAGPWASRVRSPALRIVSSSFPSIRSSSSPRDISDSSRRLWSLRRIFVTSMRLTNRGRLSSFLCKSFASHWPRGGILIQIPGCAPEYLKSRFSFISNCGTIFAFVYLAYAVPSDSLHHFILHVFHASDNTYLGAHDIFYEAKPGLKVGDRLVTKRSCSDSGFHAEVVVAVVSSSR